MSPTPSLSKRERVRVLAEIRGRDRLVQVEAAKKAARDPALFPELRALLLHERREDTRHAVTFALSWQGDPRSWPVLLRLLADRDESPVVRAQAAEGLAYSFHRKRRGSAGFQAAVTALTAALRDPSSEVRFFAAFALGASGDRSVLPVLRRVTRDVASPTSIGGSVGDEARAAIERIRLAAK